MKKTLITLVIMLLALPAWGQMTDAQALQMAQQYASQGMSQTEIVSQLMRRGVSAAQLQRLQNSAANAGLGNNNQFGVNDQNAYNMTGDQSTMLGQPIRQNQDLGTRLRTNPVQQSTLQSVQSAANPNAKVDPLSGMAIPNAVLVDAKTGRRIPTRADSLMHAEMLKAKRPKIFGHDIFSGKKLTFEPSLNIATPDNYVLGPGDEVIVDIWGDSEQTIRQTISPDGVIVVSQLGPVALSGLTAREANLKLRSRLASTFGGAQVKLSLGRIRSIQVHVMGEVERPGTYTVPSLATLFHVLYNAGGVNDIGSLREISVSRGGARIATVDVYDYILHGSAAVDIALRDGDVVVVPPWRNLVEIAGRVKRPMKYEMRDSENVQQLIDFAGGFAGDAHRDVVSVIRRGGSLDEVLDVRNRDFGSFRMADGDSVAVRGGARRFANRLEITGAVYHPGHYSTLDTAACSIRGLVAKAGGVMGDGFTARAVLTREKPDYTLEVLPIDVGEILSGVAPDIRLRNGDVLNIASEADLRERYTVSIRGEVQRPGEYVYADNLTVEDMIVAAGGMLESASTVRADIHRRIKNPNSIAASEFRSETFSVSVMDGLRTGGAKFILQPFDIVTIRTSPGYEKQKPVAVLGEVVFPGEYSLVKREERLSDLVKMSGGALSTAYLQGAKLIRRKAETEQTRAQAAMRFAKSGAGRDSLSMDAITAEEHYSVGIELDHALAEPGSDWDLVLAEGDVLFVPEYVGTVAISGAVLYPNTVSYREGQTIAHYIGQAGGFAHRARKRACFIVYMNGTIARVSMSDRNKIAPGSEIVVPHKSVRGSRRFQVSDLLNIGSSATSAASLITSITGL